MSDTLDVLIIDDMPELRKVLRLLLERTLRVIVREADGGLSAIESILYRAPDLIFCDLLMPEMTGLEFLAFLSRQQQLKRSKVIVLTTDDDEKTHGQVEDLHVDAFLLKPFNPDSIMQTVQRIVPKKYFL